MHFAICPRRLDFLGGHASPAETGISQMSHSWEHVMQAPDLDDNDQENEQEDDNQASDDSQQTEDSAQAAVAPRNRSATSPLIINK
ncbi:MAG: hypothetical protein ABIO74_08595 [Dokdonella sp.]